MKKQNKATVPEDNHDQTNGDLFGDAHEPETPAGDTDFDPAKLGVPEGRQAPGGDVFDPEFLGLGQDFATEAGVGRAWDIIKVEKPSKSRIFRTHPDPKFRLKTVLLTLKEDNESYLVHPSLRQALAGESLCAVHHLVACVSKAGTPFLWAIRAADPDGKWNVWHQSAFHIAEKARDRWCRLESNRDAGHYVGTYDVRPPHLQQEPEWPDLPFSDWLRLAFQGYTIDSLEHPVLKKLRLED